MFPDYFDFKESASHLTDGGELWPLKWTGLNYHNLIIERIPRQEYFLITGVTPPR